MLNNQIIYTLYINKGVRKSVQFNVSYYSNFKIQK